jgi:soluble cytochrome b562
MLLSKDKIDDTKVYAQVGKNRSGKANVNLEFKVNFSHFKFLSGNKVSNDKKPDSTTKQKEIKDFSGFGGGF